MEPVPVGDLFQLEGSTLEGRFVVEGAIAEGGFGVVYRGEQAALERPIALKVLKTPGEFGAVARDRFLSAFAAEAKTIARITHPNIVQVYDFGVSTMPSGERAAWMALEWLTGATLEEELLARRGGGGRTPKECLDLLRPVLAAVATVHAAGVAHRDLKPANFMLVPSVSGKVPKVLDFGIAKIMGDDEEAPGTGHTATRSRQIAFSPAYAAPEQVTHGRSGPWTDVHALSLILTEMLTDSPPLAGPDTTTLFQQILDPTRPTPRKLGVDVGAWEAVLARAVALAPAGRYKDASDLLAALEATVGDATGACLAHRERASMPVGAPRQSQPESPSPQTMLAVTSHAEAVSNVSALGPTIVRASGSRRPPWVIAAVFVGALSMVAGVAAFGRGTHQPTPTSQGFAMASPPDISAIDPAKPMATAPATGTVEEAPPPLAAVVPAPPASPPTTTVARVAGRARAPTSSPPPSPPLPSVATRPLPPAPPPAPAKPPNCDPPFTVDATGTRHYKPECDN